MNKNLIVSIVDAEEQGEVTIRTSDVKGFVIVGIDEVKRQVALSEMLAMVVAIDTFMNKEGKV